MELYSYQYWYVKLKQISVKDDKEGKVKCPQQVLEAGKSMSCTSKSGKAKEGLYKNIAKVKAKTKEGTVISDSDSSHYKGSSKPQTDPVPPVAKDDYRGG